MERTRSAILAAAASVLARDRTATLPQIAAAAGVGRTTVHRYYADRDTLIKAAVEDSAQVIGEAIGEARLDEGPPVEALHRLVTAYLSVGDRLVFLFNDPHVMQQYGVDQPEQPPSADPVMDLIERGQREGVFDDQSTAWWIQHVLWALVYTGIDEVSKGNLSRHGVAATVIRTLERGILA
ncbi:TetR/AcrR family transcriptional regulator [Kibdelosporangium phytohabitans]|uniref:TetR family transcriptional regulator n=1 Tax=Kibdelosporangium phytohabitans TaxID=860235 RepID=A0A0N9HZT7_9PSEU|nr:TetR/AcrR family transcriptional regulator [Kibdelosporangium phytohabitans]ALG07408.1 TetR family transcriptional regulator [Kibdelosporangium phytohabitans]MBE1471706.1 AcrR family transcriptional regulator [Kibdelosporangium phytohabitans]